MDEIAQLEPIKFTWKSDANKKQCVGITAQSVQKVIPEAVEEVAMLDDPNGEKYLTVRYQEIIPMLVSCIQELKGELDTLKTKIS